MKSETQPCRRKTADDDNPEIDFFFLEQTLYFFDLQNYCVSSNFLFKKIEVLKIVVFLNSKGLVFLYLLIYLSL